MSGKAYANRKKEEDRPLGDFYSTPKSLIWAAKDLLLSEFDVSSPILEPCCGEDAIFQALKEIGFKIVLHNDLYTQMENPNVSHLDYLDPEGNDLHWFDYVVTNPPFSLWNEFVTTAKSHCKKFMMIGRMNYFGTHSRLQSGLWDHLKSVHIFNRYVDYRTPFRDDGMFNVGALCTGWFLWDMEKQHIPTIHILDVDEYAIRKREL